MPSITVHPARGKREATVDFNASMKVEDFKRAVAKQLKTSEHRVALSVKPAEGQDPKTIVRLTDLKKTLSDYKVSADTPLVWKDLGPQIGYRTVFIIEYLGPILIMLGYALRPAVIYDGGFTMAEYGALLSQNGFSLKALTAGLTAGGKPGWNPVALLGLGLWLAHFIKRELETVFVHKFSRPTMPLFNIFKNSAYYWGFTLAVGYVLCHPLYQAPANANQVAVGVALMAVSELVNFAVHMQFSRMRPEEGSGKRDVPRGPLFALVSCPNYTAEILSWVGFSIATQIGAAYFFTIVGFLQMSEWALAKHRGYLRADESYKKLGRKAIVPFLL